jgi:hypothetical protein
VSTKTLRIGFGSRAAPRRRDLAANVTEILGLVFWLYGALEIEDGAMNGLQDDLFSTQVEGDPISKMQSQPFPQGLRDGDLTFSSESRVRHE